MMRLGWGGVGEVKNHSWLRNFPWDLLQEETLESPFKTTQNSLSRNTNKTFAWNIENTASYKKAFNNHNFNLLVGQATYIDNLTTGTSVTYTNLPIDSYQDASFNFDIPAAQRIGSAYTSQEHRLTSLFSRLFYDYKEKYLFNGVIRRDGSTNFGPNNKYGTFPSFSTVAYNLVF